MKNIPSFLAWLVLGLSILAWGGTAYAYLWVQTEAEERSYGAQNAEQKAAKAARQARLKVLAVETAAERERLEHISRTDIVMIASTIEAAGKTAGAEAQVSAAIPVGNPVEMPEGAPLQKIAFIVQAEGTFSSIVQFTKVLETFPGFSSVEQFEFERVQSQERGVQPWRASIRLQVTTTSDIAS